MGKKEFKYYLCMYFTGYGSNMLLIGMNTLISHYGGMLDEEYGNNYNYEMPMKMGFDSRYEYLKSLGVDIYDADCASYIEYVKKFTDFDVENVHEYLFVHSEPCCSASHPMTKYIEDAVNIGNGCMFLIQPCFEKARQSYDCRHSRHDDLWFCSDWED